MRSLFFAELPLQVVQSLHPSCALRLHLREQARLAGELIAKFTLQLLGGLLCLARHPAAGLQRLGRGLLAAHALLLLPGQCGLQLLRGLARTVDLLM
ncbi:hypothetical protein QTI66_39265 [Variovorax sp. J22R133]|uniref:hypothetical protein n=1 Tax=Variovorax brevis TaxID=3053503 RepID=UPI0025762F42|nr:hypothetical protein [Variovorax sp. J22R133]MDM0118110.1 hypothetical protein [Variovorax sp. J22R133]